MHFALWFGLLFAGQAAFAFRADESLEAKRSLPKSATNAPAPALIPAQRAALQLAAQSDIRIEWHPGTALPNSIRGTNLGASRFSSGRALRVRGGPNVEHDALVVMDHFSPLYRIQNATNEFAVARKDLDSLGFQHVRLKQKHRGLTVVGGEVIVHFDKRAEAYQVSGRYVPDLRLDTTPVLSAGQAVAIALKELADAGKNPGTVRESPQLVIYARDTEPQLAYELAIEISNPGAAPERWKLFVHAVNGSVILRFNDIKKISAPTGDGAPANITGGIMAGEGGGVANVAGWRENNGVYYLHNSDRRWFIQNVATNGWTDNGTYAHRFVADWGNSDPVEMSAARNFDIVQRYYLEMHGRNSFDNAGIFARANVHEGIGYLNAYWDGTGFTFGDGNGLDANPLATLDICGHEYTHAVTEYTANLVYAYEPGALNESFSDILGSCVEFYAQPDGRGLYPNKSPGLADWLCGEDCWLSSTALRDLRNPANPITVGSGNRQATRYKGSFWYSGSDDNGGVHYNSGVQNFFFYLLAEGGSGLNDGITYSVTGIGITNAGLIAYRALTVYCTANTDYTAVRGAWISAALDLNPAWVTNVAQAWSAVGIGALHVTPETVVSFRGPIGGPMQPQSQSFTLFNRGAESMSWTAANSHPWGMLVSSNGVIPVGGSAMVAVQMTEAALGLPPGLYTNRVTFSNNLEAITISREVLVRIGQREFFTQLFDTEPNDLGFASFLFEPLNGDSYSICRSVANAFPVDPTGGTVLNLTDDSYAAIVLSGENTVALYQRRTNVVFVGSNGYLTLEQGDIQYSGTFNQHFLLPRISACFDDLNPANGGTFSWFETAESLVVTAENVPEYGTTATVSYQIEMFFDGRIRLTFLNVDVTDGLAGLSSGEGVPDQFVEDDLSATSECLPPDALVINPVNGLVSEGYFGGPFAPDSRAWTLTNTGGASINWAAGANRTWLDVSPYSGSLAPGASASLAAAVNSNAFSLPVGKHVGNIWITNENTGFVGRRTVLLTVNPLPPPPEAPFNPTPAHLSTGVSVQSGLAWSAVGVDCRYYVYVGTNSSVLELVAGNLMALSFQPAGLEFNRTYYWQVMASNVVGTVFGLLWQFTTAADEVHFAAQAQSVNETTGTALITVQRDNPNGGAISVQFAIAGGTASAGVDFTNVSGTLNFPEGVMTAEIQVPLIDDALSELNETIRLVLSQPSAGVRIAAPSNMIVTIVDDESPTMPLPYVLYDGDGYMWDVDAFGRIAEGSNDAFDDAFQLHLFPSFEEAQLVSGRELVIGPAEFGELDVTRRIYVPTNHAYARFLEVIHNPTSQPITTNIWITSDLGSDGNTVVVATSSGDPIVSVDDNWIVTDDSDNQLDPTVMHILANNHGLLRPSDAYRSADTIFYQFSVTIPPGETRILMHFGMQTWNRAAALAKAPQLTELQFEALEQIAPEDVLRIMNFGLPNRVRSFTWSPIGAAQVAMEPFTVTITARTSTGAIATNFNGMAAVSTRRDVPILSANFDSGMDGFIFAADPNATSNLWHRTTHRSASGTHSQYYGREGVWNYSTGNRNAGNLQSPVISLIGHLPPVLLSFNYRLATEVPTAYDNAFVQVSTDGVNWTTLAGRTDVNALRNTGAFTNWTGDLSEYVGRNIHVRFKFDTIDSEQNGFEGWYVDDVLVRSVGTTVPLSQSVAGPFVGGVWTGTLAVTEAASGIYLHCQDDQGNGGSSTTFDVAQPRPTLVWTRVPGTGEFQLSWNGTGYRLQVQTGTLAQGLGTNWMDYAGGISSPVTIQLHSTNQVLFFRLIK